MVTKDFAEDRVHMQSWYAAVQGSATWELELDRATGVNTLVEGETEGVVYGGCLSMLAASLGTPYEIQTAGKILFIEDVAAKPFQIDRMLMQMKLAGKFEGVQGIIFGEMMDCQQSPDQEYTLMGVVCRVVGDVGVPVVYGLSSGHVRGKNITLPLGIRARLKAGVDKVSLNFLEAATVPAVVPARSARR
jgi:muramoyltetrapeptide carboxypeptidase